MTPDIPLLFQKTVLQVEYRTLSRVREEFPKKSNHKAVVYVEKEMTRVINELDSINHQLNLK
jgi:hypothetical protein